MKPWLAISVALACGACTDDAPVPTWQPAEPAVCALGAPAARWQTPRKIAVTGPASNALVPLDEDMLIVVSQENTVLRYTPSTDAITVFADLGNNRGPYDATWDGERVWVTNLVARSLVVLDAQGNVLREVTSPNLKTPSGVAVTSRAVYVSNVNYLGPDLGYGPGSVTVFDKQTLEEVTTVPTAGLNPQFLTTHGDGVLVTNTGAIAFVDGEAVATTDGVVEHWSETSSPTEFVRREARLPVISPGRVATPGRPAVVQTTAYFASATAPVVYALDLDAMTWRRGVDDPITLYASTRDTLHHIATDGRTLYVTAFNDDQIWRIDPSCDAVWTTPIPAGFSALLEGAHSIAAVATPGGTQLYYILSLANALAGISLKEAP